MSAAKRKFNTLLNGLGNRSTSPLQTDGSSKNNASTSHNFGVDDSSVKRRRINRHMSINSRITSLPKSILTSSISNSMLQKASPNESQKPELSDAPTYAPWDRAAFLDRLQSYSNITDWTDKPAKVNEVEWAKRGWKCKGFERVRCVSCNVELLVKLNKKEVDGKEETIFNAGEIEQALVDKYAEMIITSHAEDCLWRQRGCDASIFVLSLNHSPTTLKNLRERYDTLCSLSKDLPYMHNMQSPPEFDLDTALSYLPNGFFNTTATESGIERTGQSEINRVAMILALFGWQRRPAINYRDGAAWCASCFRTLGFWLFKSKEVNDAGDEVQKALAPYLDPLGEHRVYCPWRNPESQNGRRVSSSVNEPALAAWQVVIRVLKNDYILRHDKSNDLEKAVSQGQSLDSSAQLNLAPTGELEDDDAKSIREEKDKERWARLRRVKSLFDTKATKKLSRSPSAHTRGKTHV